MYTKLFESRVPCEKVQNHHQIPKLGPVFVNGDSMEAHIASHDRQEAIAIFTRGVSNL